MSQRWKTGNQFGRQAKPKKPCANPIFEGWITEWKEEAEAKDNKMKYVYAKALQSLRKYPLPLSSGKECSILENFGNHMCKMIENRMVKENLVPLNLPSQSESSQGLQGVIDLPDELPGTSKRAKASKANKKPDKSKKKVDDVEAMDVDGSDDEENSGNARFEKPKPVKRGKQYVPAYRSGAYALLLALFKKENEADYRGYMTKTELQHDAQFYCDSSLTKPDTAKNSHYTAWSSMKSLLNKELIFKRGNPAQFFLSPEGRTLGQKLANAETGGTQLPQANEDEVESDLDLSSQDDENEIAFVVNDYRMEAGTFEVVLYVDTCEINGRSKTQEVVNELQKNGVTAHVTRLSVGDFVWVCRKIVEPGADRNRLTIRNSDGLKDLILPYVVERKRADDLAHSIRDGRYREQKHRLLQTKLRVVYLIEAYGKGDWGLAEGALAQAMCNTQVVNEFHIHETASIKDTCAYLTFMTRHLKKLYENKTLIGRQKNDYRMDEILDNPNEKPLMYFSDFNDYAVKKTQWNVKEMFARHLMRMRGLSVDKAYAIIQQFPTIHDLFKAYSECATEKQRQLLLSGIYFGNGDRKIGPSISRKVAFLYNNTNLS